MDNLKQQIDKYQNRINILEKKLKRKQHNSFPAKIYGQTITDNWSMYFGDCVETVKGLPDNSIHYSIFSPPFLSLYVYSDSEEDMGNARTDEEFYTHFEYLIPELFRVLKQGRLISIHCSIISLTLGKDGVMGLRDFPGEIVRLFKKHGFIYHSKVNIWKEPIIQATRTKMLPLSHKQVVKDATRCSQSFADEILTFRKPGINEEPVSHGRGFEYYIGEKPEPKATKRDNPAKNKYSQLIWRRYADPVWMDINQSNTLNFRKARGQNDEKHICPLQLQVIQRCLELWSNKGDVILSPFAGIGSEGYVSLEMERKFIGIELKKSYYQTAIKNLKIAERKSKKLF